MLELRSHVPAESADPIVERLSRTPGLSHLTLIPLATTSSVVIQAELDPVHADAILAELESMGLTGESTLIRHATIPIGEQAGRPDDSFIWTHRDGEQMTKKQLLDQLRAGQLKYSKLETTNVTITVYGATAIVRGASPRQRISFPGSTGSGDANPFTAFYTLTFVNKDGEWKALAMHTSRP